MNKIVVVGCGNVGVKYASELLSSNSNIDELILIDVNKEKAMGEAMDLSNTLYCLGLKTIIKAGTYLDAKDAKIVVIAAGANQNKNETRLDLVNKNNKIIKDITLKIVKSGFNGIFLIASNPVDVMAYLVRKYSKFPAGKVIGSGTMLDTSRLAYLLSHKLEVNIKDINAYVLGEHGDSSFAVWSSAKVGSVLVKNIIPKEELGILEDKVKHMAYKIIELKGETSYGIGMCLVSITNAILNNENKVLVVSSLYDDIYLSMPSVINESGIKGIMKVELTKEEEAKLKNSAKIIRQTIKSLEE